KYTPSGVAGGPGPRACRAAIRTRADCSADQCSILINDLVFLRRHYRRASTLRESTSYFTGWLPLKWPGQTQKLIWRKIMNRFKIGAFLGVALALALPAFLAAAPASSPPDRKPDGDSEKSDGGKSDGGKFEPFKSESVSSNGSVTIGGQSIAYQAIAGTLIVHPKDWDDVPQDPKSDRDSPAAATEGTDAKNPNAEASMFYVAYFKSGGGQRPITFLYNGGPGSATVWLHLGAFGPRHIVTATDAHTPAAPYSLVNNGSSLLDATDLVFIDAPGTGFSRIAGKDKGKAFFGA